MDAEAIRVELGRVLLATEDVLAARDAPEDAGTPPMSPRGPRWRPRTFVRPDLLGRVTDAFTTLGVVGEQESSLVTWLTLTSRLSDRPLGAVIQSSSSAGKSTLADAALALIPQEHKVAYSAMTGQALYYLGEHRPGPQGALHRRGRGRRLGLLML